MLLLLPSLLLSRSLCCSVAEHTSLCMFAVHSQRDKNIAANQAMLAQLGLLEDATALRTSQQKTHQQKPKVKKATPLSVPSRQSSGRAEKLEKLAAQEAAVLAKRKAEEEAILEEKREQARLARKQREVIARREAAKEAKRKAKLEEERRARARQLAEARRERDAEMRRLRQERAEAARRMREEARRERAAAAAELAEEIRERKANLRHATRDSVEDAVESAATRRAQSAAAASGRASARRVAAGIAKGEEYVTVYEGMCTAPGCSYKLHHFGPCSNEVVREGERRGAARKVQSYADVSDADFSREFGLKLPYVPSPKKPTGGSGGSAKQRIHARSMLATGHAYVGRRVARLFGKRLVLGTVTGWLPACKVQGEPALFRVVHDDGGAWRAGLCLPSVLPLSFVSCHLPSLLPPTHLLLLATRNVRAPPPPPLSLFFSLSDQTRRTSTRRRLPRRGTTTRPSRHQNGAGSATAPIRTLGPSCFVLLMAGRRE